MKAAFICTRPYQLFCFINMVMNDIEGLRENSDLFLCDFPALISLKPALEKTGLFNNIYEFRDGRNGRAEVFFDMVFSNYSVKRDLIDNVDSLSQEYDILLATSYHPFFVRCCNMNKGSKIIMVDDGMGTYLNLQDDRYRTSLFHIILDLFFKKGIRALKIDSLYVNDPRMLYFTYNCNVFELPVLSNETVSMLNRVFGNNQEHNLRDKRIIYLTQPTDLDCMNPSFEEERVQAILGKYHDNVITRVHPSQTKYSTQLLKDNSFDLWEIKAEDISEQQVLIASFSTAQFTPHMFFKKDPIIIFFYKLVYKHDELVYKKVEQFVEVFRENYGNDIFCPDSYDELESIVDKIMQEKI